LRFEVVASKWAGQYILIGICFNIGFEIRIKLKYINMN
jgi:hypothetical protein